MKKTIVAIFAHPDDEAFGPSGTLAKLAKDNDVYIISVTRGESGQNALTETAGPIGDIRSRELMCSARTLGVKNVFFLDYRDGELNNNLYHQIAAKIKAVTDKIRPEILITFEPRGISGHIDHIAVSMISAYVFDTVNYAKELWYYCITREHRQLSEKLEKKYFIYRPPGYEPSEIDKIVDISDVWDIKMKAMDCHQSQSVDVNRLKKRFAQLPKEENFQVVTKK